MVFSLCKPLGMSIDTDLLILIPYRFSLGEGMNAFILKLSFN